MPHPKPYPRCIFCDADADSREHAIPKWLPKRLGLKGRFLYVAESFGPITPRKQPISVASHRERIFCTPCNQHFKKLEDRAIPIIEPMARGQRATFGQQEQRTAALWGAKTGVALIAAERDLRELVPQDHRHSIRYDDQPHPNSYVAFVPWAGRAHKHVGELAEHTMNPPPRAYNSVLTIGQLALKVFGLIGEWPADYFIEGERTTIKQFWPELARPVEWPPPPTPAIDPLLGYLIDFVPLRRRIISF